MNKPKTHCDDTPNNSESRKPYLRRDLLQNEIAGQFARDVGCIVDDQTVIVLHIRDVQTLLQSRDLRIANVGTVQERAQKQQSQGGNNPSEPSVSNFPWHPH
jgi:hypothetical protein